MSDISTPQPTAAPAAPDAQKKTLFDNFIVKSLFCIVAWMAPLPVAVVLLNFNYPEDDPFMSIDHSVTSFTGARQDLLLLVSLLPSAVLLAVLGRGMAQRVLFLFVLLVAAAAEFITLSSLQG